MQMIEIIPNWHPIFVHFTVALISIATFFYCTGFVFHNQKFGQEMLVAGRWCLWFGMLAAIATVTAGFIAYYTIVHDTPSHEAMVIHRNWALLTLSVIVIISFFSIRTYLKDKKSSGWFLLGILIAFSLVTITAWHGAELVYRYGLGVKSLPKTSHTGHTHLSELQNYSVFSDGYNRSHE